MTLKINLESILKPFTDNVNKVLSLPNDVDINSFEEVLKSFFDVEQLQIKAHEIHSTNHIPQNHSIFYLKAAPVDKGFYLTITPPTVSKLFEKFYGSKTAFSDERLTKGAVGFLIANFTELLNEKKIFPSIAFYLSECADMHDTFQMLKLELLLENSYPLVVELYFPELFVESFYDHFSSSMRPLSNDLPFTVNITIGHVKLSKDVFRACKVHDAILLDESLYIPHDKKGLGRLNFAGHSFAQVRINHSTIKFLDFNPLPDEVDMEQNSESPLKSLSEVNLEFQIEFARLNISFSEFEKLTTGQTLEIAKDNPTSCYLTLHGQRVAKGELVKVGEQMAFLVEELKNG